MIGKTAEALWQDYHFLTIEMRKFIIEQDMELFNDLINQRERLQVIIDQTPDNGFMVSKQGRNLLTEIQQVNQDITNNLRLLLKRSRRQHQVSEAYSAVSTMAVSQMNRKR